MPVSSVKTTSQTWSQDDNLNLDDTPGLPPEGVPREKGQAGSEESSSEPSLSEDPSEPEARSTQAEEGSARALQKRNTQSQMDDRNVHPRLHDPLQDCLEVERGLFRTRSGQNAGPSTQRRQRQRARQQTRPATDVPTGPLRVLPYVPPH